ncbi:MAG: TIGR00730 family Rossman fold protein [Spirochaetaceae bacterium]|nr:TIGR00730 family Rossman fold protein [Spirochaetaceae bacterium]
MSARDHAVSEPTRQAIKICVFCGSSAGSKPAYTDIAQRLGEAIARSGCPLVYGGGNVGLMGVVAEAAMSSGGRVIGIIPERLFAMVEQPELTELLIVRDMHERKALMQQKADAFIAMPGGIGTMEELFEVWSWRYIGYHRKPVALLDVEGYYQGLLGFLDHMVQEGFLRQDLRDDLLVDENPEGLVQRIIEAARNPGSAPVPKMPERRSPSRS